MRTFEIKDMGTYFVIGLFTLLGGIIFSILGSGIVIRNIKEELAGNLNALDRIRVSPKYRPELLLPRGYVGAKIRNYGSCMILAGNFFMILHYILKK